MHIDIIFNVSISMTMTDPVNDKLSYSDDLVIETWMLFAFFLLELLLMLKITFIIFKTGVPFVLT